MITTINDVYNVSNYGAVGDGVINDTLAIQAAIDAAIANNGGTVWFPPGKYLIESSLNLNGLVYLKGSGWSTDSSDKGSFIYFKDTFSGNAINVFGRAAEIHDLGFTCDQPTSAINWQPNAFGNGYAINIAVDDVKISNVLLYNVTRGINMSHHASSVGRITLDRIYGQPLREGIKIDNALDVIKVNNIHFWPFWSVRESNELKAAIASYQYNNAVGLVSYRNDNPFYSNIFCLQYSVGMLFSKSTSGSQNGKTSKFKIVNADLDFCATGLKIDGDGTTGQLSNFSCQGPDVGDPSFEGINIGADSVRLQGDNIYITEYNSNGIRIEGDDTWAMFDNVWINNWNRSLQTFPAIEAVNATSKILVGFGREFENGNGAADTGGAGTIHLSS